MKITKGITLFMILAGLIFPTLLASQPVPYSTTNKGAIKSYEAATKHYDLYQNDKAVEELNKAISKDPGFIEAYILLANVYVDKRQYETAIEQYNKALAINPNF